LCLNSMGAINSFQTLKFTDVSAITCTHWNSDIDMINKQTVDKHILSNYGVIIHTDHVTPQIW